MLRWLRGNAASIAQKETQLAREARVEKVYAVGREDPEAAVAGVIAMLAKVSPEERDRALRALRREVLLGGGGGSSSGNGAWS